MVNYNNLSIHIIHMAHVCENDMIQIEDMFQIVAMWLQFSTEEYLASLEIVDMDLEYATWKQFDL